MARYHARRMAFLIFAATAIVAVFLWNRFFTRVSLAIALLFFLITSVYLRHTLFTPRVDVPGNLAYVAYPWKASGRHTVNANTGIVFTQLAPWTRVARRSIEQGELPLFNRFSAAGSPLLANQQTALAHPFTLLGLFLSVGKAFTLSAALRIFFAQFFLYVFLRNWNLHPLAAIFGAISFAFCSFSVIWLLFPLGLATWGVVPGLAAVDEFFRRARIASFVFLVFSLTLPILGGHPESALWVGLTLAAYGIYALAQMTPRESHGRCLAGGFGAAMLAVALTAAWWMPTLEILPRSSRHEHVEQWGRLATPPLPSAWSTTLLAPNILGTPSSANYKAPEPRYPLLIDDYGEIASGYAGVLALGLAACALFIRSGLRSFFGSTAIATLLTLTRAPLWYPVFRKLPLIGLALDQRLRFLWCLSVIVLAAVALDALLRGVRSRSAAVAVAIAGLLTYLLYATSDARDPHAIVAAAVAAIAASLIAFAPRYVAASALSLLALVDLTFATKGYNPPARPVDVYSPTPAIEAMKKDPAPHRIAALGWSLLPETPAWYGLEDVKTTDPLSSKDYLRLMRGYLGIDPGNYDQAISDTSYQFFDYLNIEYVYVPPNVPVPPDPALETVYRGGDGVVLRNREVFPRYFFVRNFVLEPRFDVAVLALKNIGDLRQTALVDRLPAQLGSHERGTQFPAGAAELTIRRYENNSEELDVRAESLSLLVSSDAWWPGWRATLDGKPLDVVKVNGAFVGVFVPPGKGLLRIDYRPHGFVTGSAISASAAALLALTLIGLKMTANASRRRMAASPAR
jgi:hypothetical protein